MWPFCVHEGMPLMASSLLSITPHTSMPSCCLCVVRPTMNSRYLMFRAQQAQYHGIDPILALASVRLTPENAFGLGRRFGSVAEGSYLFAQGACISHPPLRLHMLILAIYFYSLRPNNRPLSRHADTRFHSRYSAVPARQL